MGPTAPPPSQPVYLSSPPVSLNPKISSLNSLFFCINFDASLSNKKMSSIIQTIQKNRTFNLPTTTTTDSAEKGLLRRRLSSISLNLHPISSSANSWSALRRSKSVSDAGSSIRKWLQWSCNWLMSRKPIFTQDLEMNEDETSALGSHSRGSVKHLFYKIKSEIKKLIGSGQNVGLPQTYRYDSINYAKNFNDGRRSY